VAIDYFTEAELRALPQMSDTVTYTTARVEAAAAHITSIIEREVGTSFISRTVTAEIHDGGEDAIVLRKPYVISVTSATEDGVAVTDTLRAKSGILRRFSSSTSFTPIVWTTGTGNVSVTYQAGYTALADIPKDVKEAAMKGTRAYLLETNSNAAIDDRRTSMNTEMGTINYVIAGEDRPTGYPQVDAVILAWKARLNNYGFA